MVGEVQRLHNWSLFRRALWPGRQVFSQVRGRSVLLSQVLLGGRTYRPGRGHRGDAQPDRARQRVREFGMRNQANSSTVAWRRRKTSSNRGCSQQRIDSDARKSFSVHRSSDASRRNDSLASTESTAARASAALRASMNETGASTRWACPKSARLPWVSCASNARFSPATEWTSLSSDAWQLAVATAIEGWSRLGCTLLLCSPLSSVAVSTSCSETIVCG